MTRKTELGMTGNGFVIAGVTRNLQDDEMPGQARHDVKVGGRDDETLNQVQGDEEGRGRGDETLNQVQGDGTLNQVQGDEEGILKQFLIFDHRNL